MSIDFDWIILQQNVGREAYQIGGKRKNGYTPILREQE